MERIHNLLLILKYFYDKANDKEIKITRTKLRHSVGRGIKRSDLSHEIVEDVIKIFLEYNLIVESGIDFIEIGSYSRKNPYYKITERGKKLFNVLEKLGKGKSLKVTRDVVEDLKLIFGLNTIFKPPIESV